MPPRAIGKKARKKQLEEPFRFEDLPAELREDVYESILVRDGVHILQLSTDINGVKRIFPKEIINDKDGNRVRVASRFLPKRATSILRVNKLLNKEALPILYGKNKFEFTSLPALRFLIKSNPTGADLLRRLSIFANGLETFPPAIRKLRGVENLRTLEIRLNPNALIENRINTFVTAICAFVKRREGKIEQQEELDKITFVAEYDWDLGRVASTVVVSSSDAPAFYDAELRRRFNHPDKVFNTLEYRQAKAARAKTSN